jgi:hypothetical protein
MAAAGNEGNGEKVMTLLLSQRGDQVTIIEDVVIALLLSQRGGL